MRFQFIAGRASGPADDLPEVTIPPAQNRERSCAGSLVRRVFCSLLVEIHRYVHDMGRAIDLVFGTRGLEVVEQALFLRCGRGNARGKWD